MCEAVDWIYLCQVREINLFKEVGNFLITYVTQLLKKASAPWS
jgi:hypothetical protein